MDTYILKYYILGAHFLTSNTHHQHDRESKYIVIKCRIQVLPYITFFQDWFESERTLQQFFNYLHLIKFCKHRFFTLQIPNLLKFYFVMVWFDYANIVILKLN